MVKADIFHSDSNDTPKFVLFIPFTSNPVDKLCHVLDHLYDT